MTMSLRSTARRAILQTALGAAFVSLLGACAAEIPDEGTSTTNDGLSDSAFTTAQARWIEYVGDEVVGTLEGSPQQRARTAAIVTWWALKEGVLDIAPNPWRHNLCTRPGGDVQIGDLGVCSGPAWQVGLSGIQVGNVTSAQVESTAARLYPNEALSSVLARIAKTAGVSDEAANAIATSTGDLRKSWLLRDPAIGITLQRGFVETECLQQGMAWCFGGWDQARAFASSAARIQQVISELEARFASGAKKSSSAGPPGGAIPDQRERCPLGAGLYCGGNHVKGDPTMLYDCSAAGLVPVQRCANGCEWMPDGKHDRCAL